MTPTRYQERVLTSVQQTINVTKVQDHAWSVGSWGAAEFWGIILRNLEGKFDIQVNNNIKVYPLMGETRTLDDAVEMIRKHIRFAVRYNADAEGEQDEL